MSLGTWKYLSALILEHYENNNDKFEETNEIWFIGDNVKA